MKFTDVFIKRPALATVISLFIFSLGLKSIFNLDVRQYPKVENTVITITTAYPGASAELMQGFVTQPIQTAVAAADGIDFLTSTSSQSLSTVTAKLRLNYDSSTAFTDILSKVNSVTNQLPQNSQLPVVTKTSGSSISLLYVNYTSDKLTSSQIYDYLTRVVQPKIQSVAGISSADILGGNPFALRVWLKPIRMAALKVTTEDINQALLTNNYLSAAGQLKGLYTIININAHTDLHTVKEFKNLVVRQNNKKLIHLSDVAEVELGSENYSSSVTFNGNRGVFIGINALPSANPLTVIKDIRKELPNIEKGLPPSLKQTIVYDSSKFISASLYDVIKTLIEATLIVVFVIFLFLGSFRSVIIPVVTIPLSLVGVAFIMFILGYSLNLLTLLAMVLAIGLVVDDAIVVVENIHRHIEEGKTALEGSLIGAREIAMPVISMTITLAAVYAPIGLMSGLTGALFKEFALTLAASVIVSGIVALTLSPMMCSKFLAKTQNRSKFLIRLEDNFTRIQLAYEKRLSRVLKQKTAVKIFAAVVLACVYFLFILTPKELAPHEDQGFLLTINSAPAYANIHYLEKFTQEEDKIFSQIPEHDAHFIINGRGSENTGIAGVIFKPWDVRTRKASKIQPIIQDKLNSISGIQSFIFALPDLPTGSDGLPFQFVIRSTASYPDLFEVTQELLKKIKKSGMFIIANSDLSFETPELNIKINSAKASEMNISMKTIGDTLGTLLGGNYINRFSMDGRSYKIIAQLQDKNRYNPEDLKKSYIRSNSGELVPLANFISLETKSQPGALHQFQQLNSVTISAIIMIGKTQGDCVEYMRKEAKNILPKGMTYDFSGETRAFVQEGNSLLYTFIFAILMIYLVLSAQFESFRDPLVIMVSVPMAICGALIPLNLGLATINIYTEIGLVTLIGLITKHGILMVEFANQLRREHNYDLDTAIHMAASTRLRPILMTTAAMVLGSVPLVFASGAGAASRHDLGLVITFGLTIGTFFTLFIVPSLYSTISKKEINNAN